MNDLRYTIYRSTTTWLLCKYTHEQLLTQSYVIGSAKTLHVYVFYTNSCKILTVVLSYILNEAGQDSLSINMQIAVPLATLVMRL